MALTTGARLVPYEIVGAIGANHPNIAIVHGVETKDGIRALVMEMVDGQLRVVPV